MEYAGIEENSLEVIYGGDLFLETYHSDDVEQGDIIFFGDVDYALESIHRYAVVLNKDQQARFMTTSTGYILSVEELKSGDIYRVVK